MIRSIVRYAARSGHPGRCGSTCAIRFHSATKAMLLFDDTVLDKRHSHFIEMVRRQWSGNAHAVIPGIGVVTCVYVNPELQRFWVLDFRLFDPERDGRSKIDHLLEMFDRVLQSCASSIRVVLMDSWYASRKVIKAIEGAHNLYILNRNFKQRRALEMVLPTTGYSGLR